MSERASFTTGIDQVQFAASGNPDTPGDITVRGLASVYNKPSHDLGGFRTVIKPGAFNRILASAPMPDIHLVLDHDTRYALARTTNGSLELRDTPAGLHFWARMAPTSYAKDLQMLMERGVVDQCSFACTIGKDEWQQSEQGDVTRFIESVDEMYDVTITAQGAFPQTHASLVASFQTDTDALADAYAAGRVLGPDGKPVENFTVARESEGESTVESLGAGGQDVEPCEAGDRSDNARLRLARLKVQAASVNNR